MKERRIKKCSRLEIGELYLFHTTNSRCPSADSLWGVFDRTEGKRIWLETTSRDLLSFTRASRLPPHYRFFRRATRTELRDYWYNCGAFESGYS